MVRYLFYTIGDLTYQSPLVLSGGRTVDPWYGAVPPRISSHRKRIQRWMAGIQSYLFGYKALDKMLRRTLFILSTNLLMLVSFSGECILHRRREQFLSPAGPQAGCAMQ